LNYEKLIVKTQIEKCDVNDYNQEIKLFPFINIDVFKHKNKGYDLDFHVFIIKKREKILK